MFQVVVRRRVGQGSDDLRDLDDRAGPAMDEHERDRIGSARLINNLDLDRIEGLRKLLV